MRGGYVNESGASGSSVLVTDPGNPSIPNSEQLNNVLEELYNQIQNGAIEQSTNYASLPATADNNTIRVVQNTTTISTVVYPAGLYLFSTTGNIWTYLGLTIDNNNIVLDGNGRISLKTIPVLNSLTINNAPVNATDAVNKTYADSRSLGQNIRSYDPVNSISTDTVVLDTALVNLNNRIQNVENGIQVSEAVAAASGINIAAPGLTIDGVTMVNGQSFLKVNVDGVTNDPTPGLYIYNGAATPATRSPKMATWDQVTGAQVIVNAGGTLNGSTVWTATVTPTGTIDTTPITFTKNPNGVYQSGTNISISAQTISLVASPTVTSLSISTTTPVGTNDATTKSYVDTRDNIVRPINLGGTGQTTSISAFNALSPMNTRGDMIWFDGSTALRLGGNVLTTHKFLTQFGDNSNLTNIQWDSVTLEDTAITSTFTPSLGTIATLDTGTQAFQKVQGNLNVKPTYSKLEVSSNITLDMTTQLPINTLLALHFNGAYTVTLSGFTFGSTYAGNTSIVITGANDQVWLLERPATGTVIDILSAPTSGLTGIVPIAQGGTGQTTKSAGFNALSPMTANGDIIYGGTSGQGTTLPGNITTTRQFLRSVGTSSTANVPAWDTLTKADVGLNNVPNTDATNLSNDTIQGTFTTTTGSIISGDDAKSAFQKVQGNLDIRPTYSRLEINSNTTLTTGQLTANSILLLHFNGSYTVTLPGGYTFASIYYGNASTIISGTNDQTWVLERPSTGTIVDIMAAPTVVSIPTFLTPAAQTGTFTATANTMNNCSLVAINQIATLPSTPTNGTQIGIKDKTGVFGSGFPLIVNTSGSAVITGANILANNTLATMILSIEKGTWIFEYVSSTNEWMIITEPEVDKHLVGAYQTCMADFSSTYSEDFYTWSGANTTIFKWLSRVNGNSGITNYAGNGTQANSPTVITNPIISTLKSVQYNGTSQYLVANIDLTVNNNPNVTAFIVFTTGATFNVNGTLIGSDAGLGRVIGVGTRAGGGTNLYAFNGSGVVAVGTLVAITTYILCVNWSLGSPTINGGNMSVYVNSINNTSYASNTAPNGASTTGIGSLQGGAELFNGRISDVLFFNRNLTKPQRSSVMNMLANRHNITLT